SGEVVTWELGSWNLAPYDCLLGFVPGIDGLVSANGGVTHLWNAGTGAKVRSFDGGFASLSRDGETLATWHDEAATRLWKVSTGEKLLTLGKGGYPIFHPDGETVATFGGRGVASKAPTEYWNRTTGKLQPDFAFDRLEIAEDLASANPRDKRLGFNPDGKLQAHTDNLHSLLPSAHPR